MRVFARLVFAVLHVYLVSADLRFASRPRESYKLRNEGNTIEFVTSDTMIRYMEPSTFEYQNLAGNNGQRRKNYDQFLRSNVDNEQDNRNFNEDAGEDHLPFRTKSTAVLTQGTQVDITLTMNAGQETMVPLRWNNPHASELEVNIWIFPLGLPPVVVPIKKPTCSGEGYQNNIVKFRIPFDFNQLGAKIPGFTGCKKDTLPMCTVQVYSHSVESRTYAYGFPIIINGVVLGTAANTVQIKQPALDPRMDVKGLRPLCLPNSDPTQHIAKAVPQWANLFSDAYNHAYQNSDFSPYSGQQHDQISQNLQAAAINKMVTGNRGELGKSILPQATKNKINQLANLENKVYKKYESLANNIIKRLGNQMKETGTVAAGQTSQQLANAFRVPYVGSTKQDRQQTNTYIPSFQLPENLIDQARSYVPEKYKQLITANGTVQIYVAALNDLMPSFLEAAKEYGILYQPNQIKDTLTSMKDTTQFKKRNADGQTDGGVYAATEAKQTLAAAKKCPESCLTCPAAEKNRAALIKNSQGTCVSGNCAGCLALFHDEIAVAPLPTPISEDLANATDPVAALPPTPDVEEIEVYPDEDGTPRVGRPPSPSTEMPESVEDTGVVAGSCRPVCASRLMALIVFTMIASS